MVGSKLSRSFQSVKDTGSLYEKDLISGFYVSDDLLEQLYEDGKTRRNAHLVCGDFTNFKQINEVMGRDAANAFIATICAIYQSRLSKLNPSAQIGFRKGDNTTWIIEGANITQENLIRVLAEAEAETKAFVVKSGLSTLQHPRHANITGTGLSTAFSSINSTSGSFKDSLNSLNLQLDTMRDLRIKDEEITHPPREFWRELYNRLITLALSATEPARNNSPDHKLPKGFIPVYTHLTQTRAGRQEVGELQQIIGRPHASGSLSRFSLYNLGGFNGLLGNELVDEYVLKPLQSAIVQTLEDLNIKKDNYSIFQRDGGEFDIILRGDDGSQAQLLQARVYKIMKEAVFNHTIEDFTQARQIEVGTHDIAGDTLLSNIPHKRDQSIGGGIVMMSVDLGQAHSHLEAFQKLEEQKRLNDRYAVSYFEKNDTGLTAHMIRHSGKWNEIHLMTDSLPDEKCNPRAWGMNETLNHHQLGELFKKPIGMIYETITGISLQPVLERQKIIFNMLDRGVSQDEIISNLKPVEKFDAYVARAVSGKDDRPFDVADRPSSRPQQTPKFLTMNLAQSWGYIPPNLTGLSQALLEAQGATRAMEQLNDYRNGYRNARTAEVIGEIRSRAATILLDAKSKDLSLHAAQMAALGLEIGKHEHPMTARDPNMILAAYSLIVDTLKDVSSKFGAVGMDNLAGEAKKLTTRINLGNRAMPTTAALPTLSGLVDRDSANTSPSNNQVILASFQVRHEYSETTKL